MTPHIPPEVEARLRHMLGLCSYSPLKEYCNHIPTGNVDDEEMMSQILALITEHSAERERQIKLIQEKVRELEAGVIAIDHYINKPFPDDPRWTPYSRFIHPRMYSLRKAAFDNEDVGELAALAQLSTTNKEKE